MSPELDLTMADKNELADVHNLVSRLLGY